MYNYRYMIYVRKNGMWCFENAFMTEEAADKHAALLSRNRTHVKVIERYEDVTYTARILRIYHFYNGRYHHMIRR